MRLLLPLLMVLGASETFALLDLTKTVSSTTLTSQACVTGSKSTKAKGALPTSTVISTRKTPKLKVTYKNSTPVVTYTAKPITKTVTSVGTSVTTKTDSAVTDTYSTTLTLSSTITSIATTTTVFTSTDSISTTTTSTVTIPTPAGYVPIQQSSGETNYPVQAKARSIGHPHDVAKRDAKFCKNAPVMYPFSVTCTKYIQVEYTIEIIKTKPTSTTTVVPKASTMTSTSISISTTTIMPRASTTQTFSVTSLITTSTTLTESSTVTTTSTVVVQSPGPTVLAACQDYILGPRVASGKYAYNYDTSAANPTYLTPAVANGYECCVACFNNPNCLVGAYSTTANVCVVTVGTTCPASQPLAGYFTETTGQNQFNAQYWNGPCGSWAYNSAE